MFSKTRRWRAPAFRSRDGRVIMRHVHASLARKVIMKPTTIFFFSLALVACAGHDVADRAQAASQRDCFSTASVSGYSPIDDDTIRIWAGGVPYELDVAGVRCGDINWSQRMSIEQSVASASMCVGPQGGGANIRFRDEPSGVWLSCRIEDVRRAPSPEGGH
jgi:hypothetical protein